MGAFLGVLRSNEVLSALYNMIISQQVFADNIGKHQTLVDKARVDGSLYGDTKLYYSADALKSVPWGNDAEASNLLALHRPAAPECQAIHLDQFRQISLTIDNYLSKRAWSTEAAFAEFTSVMLGWMRETKLVYDGTTYNSYIGTAQTSVGKQMVSVDVSTARGSASTEEEANRLEAMAIAQSIADLLVEMGDYSRDFNDYGHLRSYAEDSIRVIWNSKFVNKIKKIDTPTIFNREGLVNKLDEDILPARYFGTVITSSNVASFSDSTPAAGKPIDSDDSSYVPGSNHANGCIRSLVEKDITVSAVAYHVFPGDEIPAGATIKASGTFELGEVYIEQADIICKVVVKLPVFMSAFEVGTSFFNAKSLTENRYLTFSHNTIEYFKNYPFITVKAI